MILCKLEVVRKTEKLRHIAAFTWSLSISLMFLQSTKTLIDMLI